MSKIKFKPSCDQLRCMRNRRLKTGEGFFQRRGLVVSHTQVMVRTWHFHQDGCFSSQTQAKPPLGSKRRALLWTPPFEATKPQARWAFSAQVGPRQVSPGPWEHSKSAQSTAVATSLPWARKPCSPMGPCSEHLSSPPPSCTCKTWVRACWKGIHSSAGPVPHSLVAEKARSPWHPVSEPGHVQIKSQLRVRNN